MTVSGVSSDAGSPLGENAPTRSKARLAVVLIGLAATFVGVWAFTDWWWPGLVLASGPGASAGVGPGASEGVGPRVVLLLLERSPALWANAQPWRAVTSLFVHVNATHLVTSVASLWWWFAWATKTSGAAGAERRLFAGLVVAIVCNGGLAAVSASSAVGASLWVATLVGDSFARARRVMPGRHLTEAALGASVLLASSLSIGVDHVGHAVGVAAGFALGLASGIAERRGTRGERPHVAPAILVPASHVRTLLVLALVAVSLGWGVTRAVRCASSPDALQQCASDATLHVDAPGDSNGVMLLQVE